jgi:hypothetical protein
MTLLPRGSIETRERRKTAKMWRSRKLQLQDWFRAPQFSIATELGEDQRDSTGLLARRKLPG